MKKIYRLIAFLPLCSLLLSVGCGNSANESDSHNTAEIPTEHTPNEQSVQRDEDSSKTQEADDDSVIWVINNADLAARLQEPLNRLLAEKKSHLPFLSEVSASIFFQTT